VAMIIILYVVFWLFWLNRGAKEPISIAASLMVCAILIHSLLEYPIHYAYFLLPLGFLLGIIQGQYSHLPTIKLKPVITAFMIVMSLLLITIIYRDYTVYRQQSVLVDETPTLSEAQQQVMKQDIWLLTQLKERVWWICFDPRTKLSEQQLQYLGRMVANTASKYDLYKYAQVLAFNGKKTEAEHQLWILKTLHDKEYSYQDLLVVSALK